MLQALILFAQADDKPTPDPLMSMLPIMAIGVLFFFLILMPKSRQQRKEQEALLANLKKNDEVVTSSGIIGIVTNIKETGDEVTLKIDDNARIRVLKSSIVRIVPKEGAPSAPVPNTSIKPAT